MGESRVSASGGKTKVIGDYELISRVGKGGMGSVFKARRISTGETVAFKALPPSFAKNADLVARFKREVRILLGLTHENIIQGFDSGSVGNLHYLAMEFVDGQTVSVDLARKKRLPRERVIAIMTAVARALAYAHSEGLIHRDVKPDNILIRSDGVVKLCDLGLAREQADTGFTMVGARLGTPKYMSPEQVEGSKSIDGRADVYSLGATAYHLLTGTVPHSAPTGTMIMRAQMFGTIQPIKQVLPRWTNSSRIWRGSRRGRPRGCARRRPADRSPPRERHPPTRAGHPAAGGAERPSVDARGENAGARRRRWS